MNLDEFTSQVRSYLPSATTRVDASGEIVIDTGLHVRAEIIDMDGNSI